MAGSEEVARLCDADELFDLGNRLDEEGRYEEAVEAYQRSAALSEASSRDLAAWFLLFSFRFSRCLPCGEVSTILPVADNTFAVLAEARLQATCYCDWSEPSG